jgi:hypothetical protein
MKKSRSARTLDDEFFSRVGRKTLDFESGVPCVINQ